MIETRETFCRFCHAACPLHVDVEINSTGARTQEVVVAVRGIMEDPLFEGYTCIKGRQLADQHHAPDRLRNPLQRSDDGSFVEVTSKSALDDIAHRLQAIIAAHGPRAVATYTGTGAFQNSISMPVTQAFHSGI
ncbi:MAG: molybdopterin-dependent oxidoreductase, partial [Actinobacteria bacterium]|nr:molybdopterin-dependent oxidoreductase [Actinomycetota bacterium]